MKKPNVTLYAITTADVSLSKLKTHLRRKFHVQRVSTLQSDDINSVIFKIPLWRLNDTWNYLSDKRGIKKIWMGK